MLLYICTVSAMYISMHTSVKTKNTYKWSTEYQMLDNITALQLISYRNKKYGQHLQCHLALVAQIIGWSRCEANTNHVIPAVAFIATDPLDLLLHLAIFISFFAWGFAAATFVASVIHYLNRWTCCQFLWVRATWWGFTFLCILGCCWWGFLLFLALFFRQEALNYGLGCVAFSQGHVYSSLLFGVGSSLGTGNADCCAPGSPLTEAIGWGRCPQVTQGSGNICEITCRQEITRHVWCSKYAHCNPKYYDEGPTGACMGKLHAISENYCGRTLL